MTRETQSAWDARRAEAKAKAAETIEANREQALADLKAFKTAAAAPVVDAPVEEDEGYGTWSKDDLVAELQERGLPHSGNKDELIARLEESDGSE